LKLLNNSYLLKEGRLFFGSKAPGLVFSSNLSTGEFRQRRINFAPSAFSSLKLGAAVSPIDKLRKDGALPPVTSEKPTLFLRVPGFIYIAITFEL